MTRRATTVPVALVALAGLTGASGCAFVQAAEQSEAGAGSEGGADTGEPSGGAGEPSGGAGGGANGSAGSTTRGEGIWTPSSTAIDVLWWEFFGSSMHYGKTRAELTDEELALIDEISTNPKDTGCVFDGSWARVTVTTDGGDTSYEARVLDALCGSAGSSYVNYSGAWALLDAAGCEPRFQASATLAMAPTIHADSGCFYPFPGVTEPSEWWVLVDIAEPGSLRFAFQDCEEITPTSATLLDEEGVTELAATTASPGECPTLTVDISEPGTFALHVATEPAAPDISSFSLHVERAD